MASGEAMSARYTFGVGARTGVDALELAALLRDLLFSSTSIRRPRHWRRLTPARTNKDSRRARMLKMEAVFLSLDDLRARRDECSHLRRASSKCSASAA